MEKPSLPRPSPAALASSAPPSPAQLAQLTVEALGQRYPFALSYLAEQGLELSDEPDWTVGHALGQQLQARGQPAAARDLLLGQLAAHIAQMLDFVAEEAVTVASLTIRGGRDKQGTPEPVRELTLRAGEVTCLVGATGSGKSRLLADIEWGAGGDTPTGRVVLLDGQPPAKRWRYSPEHKLVAQLSQNMSFVIDLCVEEFLALHAESRAGEATAADALVHDVWQAANALAGEPFALDTPLTSLSGGQSRALMIADTALISRSPIVLIDEIENAGIDRRQALELLLSAEKIVLMATHDPALALLGQRRVLLQRGGMQQVIEPGDRERATAAQLMALDQRLMALRERLRRGELLEELDA